jgi:dTDP-4-amino-4,6-dideoxygalactose transaminase
LKVTLADLVHQHRSMRPEIDAAVAEVLDTAGFILGPHVAALEEEIAAYSGARYAVGVNSGTDALLLALVAQGVGPGDEVITSPFTFVATVEAIVLIGAKPVFADIDPRTFNLDPGNVAAAITSATRAIMPVDLFGQMADRGTILELAQRHNLAVVWDAAQAIGCSFDGRRLGEFSGAATLSFFPTKNLGGCGDGGMVLTNDEEVRDRLRKYRFHGSGGGYFYDRVGYCSRLDALQAAILRVKLKHLEEWNGARRRNAEVYRRRLGDAPVVLPYCDPRASHTYHQFTVRSTNRDVLKDYLKAHQIDSGVYYPLALHEQTAYASLGYKRGDFPEAERATQEVLSIPVHPDLSAEQVEYVAECINRFDG